MQQSNKQSLQSINQSIIRKLLQCSTSASITLNNAMHCFCRQHIYDLCSDSVTVISEIKYLVTLVYFNQRNWGMGIPRACVFKQQALRMCFTVCHKAASPQGAIQGQSLCLYLKSPPLPKVMCFLRPANAFGKKK